jgi:hypothetical protein
MFLPGTGSRAPEGSESPSSSSHSSLVFREPSLCVKHGVLPVHSTDTRSLPGPASGDTAVSNPGMVSRGPWWTLLLRDSV